MTKPSKSEMLRKKGSNTKASLANARQIVREGDCLAVMSGMDPKSIDVVVTSPPYNIGIDYNTYYDKKSRQDYLDWIKQVARSIRRVLKDDGSFFLNIGGTSANPLIPIDACAKIVGGVFHLQNHILWVKSISIGNDTFGHFKPINSTRFLNNNYEHIFHFTKHGDVALDRLAVGVPFKHKSNIERWGHDRDLRCAGNVWFIPYKTVQSKAEKYNHPSTFPVELAERCIKLHGARNRKVLDPFMGVGSTLVAAKRLSCEAIGIDMDAKYCAIAKRRLEAENLV